VPQNAHEFHSDGRWKRSVATLLQALQACSKLLALQACSAAACGAVSVASSHTANSQSCRLTTLQVARL